MPTPLPQNFDEEAYLLANPDVAKAVKEGTLKSGAEHYINIGHTENRIWSLPEGFDEDFYLLRNLDVRWGINKGIFASGKAHYLLVGHKEKRLYSLPKAEKSLGEGIFPAHIFRYPNQNTKTVKPTEFTPSSTSADDLTLMKRICTAYNKACKEQPKDFRNMNSGMWLILSEIQEEFLTVVKNNDYKKVSEYLGVMFQSTLTHGLAMGEITAYFSKRYTKASYDLWFDRYLRFIEALGVIPIKCPEQNSYTETFDLDPESTVAAVEKIFGTPLEYPNVGGLFGIKLKKSIFPNISFSHALVAHTIKTEGMGSNALMELGGGYGGLCYWMIRMGAKNFTIYDLPFVNLVQAYFLTKSLPGVSIDLYGEDTNATVKIKPYWMLDTCGDKKYDLVINQDSLPEMPYDIALAYIKEIKRVSSKHFYSVNQEGAAPNYKTEHGQNLVYKLVQEVPGFKRKRRSLFWGREGYVEELYEIC